MTGATGVALWYRRYCRTEYSIWDDEEEAAGVAAAMEADGGGLPMGIQFPDGRLIPAGEWAAFTEARERRKRADMEYVRAERPPRRTIRAPFGGGQVEIDAREPGWLGVQG